MYVMIIFEMLMTDDERPFVVLVVVDRRRCVTVTEGRTGFTHKNEGERSSPSSVAFVFRTPPFSCTYVCTSIVHTVHK